MSRYNLWQICHKQTRENKCLTEKIVELLRKQGKTSKEIAFDLDIPTERVRNWHYRSTGMTAFDLLLLMGEYEFIRNFADSSIISYTNYKEDNIN